MINMRSGENGIISDSEWAVLSSLRILSANTDRSELAETGRVEISQIAFTTGINDSDEVLRALYTLEGKRLVEPSPAGDFTSSQWQITENGLKALDLLRAA